MTALAMILGMVPMALAIGEGGEQNAPLGRAVIGGLAVATVATLLQHREQRIQRVVPNASRQGCTVAKQHSAMVVRLRCCISGVNVAVASASTVISKSRCHADRTVVSTQKFVTQPPMIIESVSRS